MAMTMVIQIRQQLPTMAKELEIKPLCKCAFKKWPDLLCIAHWPLHPDTH